jgi:ankyrin repeat protein
MNIVKYSIFSFLVAGIISLNGCVEMTPNIADAARNGNLADVQNFVAQGQNVNVLSGAYVANSPLASAAINGNMQIVTYLLDHGADPNLFDDNTTPLMDVIRWSSNNRIDIVTLLIERGANVNAVNPGNKFTPIMYCAAYGDAEIAQILVAEGADVNARDDHGKTAVDYAVEYKKIEVLAVLRKAGALVSYTGEKTTDMTLAILSQDHDKVRELLEAGVSVDMKTKSGKSLLVYAVGYNWGDIVELLIRKGANTAIEDESGWTPLTMAGMDNQKHMVDAFIKAGVNIPYAQDVKKNLYYAVIFGDIEKAKDALSKGADVNGRYKLNTPVLTLAAYKNDVDMVTMLLEKGANPNILNDKGICPLAAGLKKGMAAMGKLLIDHGADVNAKDDAGWPLLYYAIKTGDAALVKQMLDKGAVPDAGALIVADGRGQHFKSVRYPDIVAMIKPDILHRQMLRAQAAVEAAQTPDDYMKAINEYNLAKQLSPDSPEIYYNLGMVQDKAGLFADAIASLKKYLELSPSATDTQTVKDMIYKLEYKRDQKGGQ